MAREPNGRFSIMLGGVSCIFRREIKPYQPYEIWSRVLCWDRKWVYIVSHFVKKGDVKPKAYTLQPNKKTSNSKEQQSTRQKGNEQPNGTTPSAPATNPAIFASGVSKYVFKKGRLTIPPERILDASNMFPPKPADHHTPPISPSPMAADSSSIPLNTASVVQEMDPRDANDIIDASLLPCGDEGVWTWTRVEEERLRGMKVAELMAGLDALYDEFTADQIPALGEY